MPSGSDHSQIVWVSLALSFSPMIGSLLPRVRLIGVLAVRGRTSTGTYRVGEALSIRSSLAHQTNGSYPTVIVPCIHGWMEQR
jgi:hypothetical protein